ncbi:unnamed protein product [Rangifer tarandus platyrhynchus]|uniref:Uncharacterized protein n=1 Tax=Rangifer tarandus platyrhynchus TaxID=3082113 RepID=A0AC59YBA4_RANTA
MSSEGLWVTAGTGRVAQGVKGAGGGGPHASDRVPTLTVPQALLGALDVSQFPCPAPTTLLHPKGLPCLCRPRPPASRHPCLGQRGAALLTTAGALLLEHGSVSPPDAERGDQGQSQA